jgi:hypothetical protein
LNLLFFSQANLSPLKTSSKAQSFIPPKLIAIFYLFPLETSSIAHFFILLKPLAIFFRYLKFIIFLLALFLAVFLPLPFQKH